MGLNIEYQKTELKKHVAIIHCMNTLSLLQRKISNALLYHAYQNLQIQEEHEISIKQLCNIIGYSGNNHAAIKTALKGLLSTIIEWDVIDNATGEEDWTASTILASVRLKGPLCTYAYSPRMKSLLYSPSMYGKINLYIQARFKSSYGLALYENCIRYKGLPTTKWFDLTIFRKLMGVPDNLYPIFRDLKKRVLDKSVEEVNTFSDIRVEPEIDRVGHRVNAIRFNFKASPKKSILGKDLEENSKIDSSKNIQLEDDAIINLINNKFGINRGQAEKLVEEYGHLRILRAVDVVESSPSYLSGKIINLAAYLVKAIKEDYQYPINGNTSLNAKQVDDFEKDRNERNKQKGEYELQKQYSCYLFDFINNKVLSIDSLQRNSIFLNFETSINKKGVEFFYTSYKEEGLKRSHIKSLFIQFIKEHYRDLINDVLSYDHFKEQYKIES